VIDPTTLSLLRCAIGFLPCVHPHEPRAVDGGRSRFGVVLVFRWMVVRITTSHFLALAAGLFARRPLHYYVLEPNMAYVVSSSSPQLGSGPQAMECRRYPTSSACATGNKYLLVVCVVGIVCFIPYLRAVHRRRHYRIGRELRWHWPHACMAIAVVLCGIWRFASGVGLAVVRRP